LFSDKVSHAAWRNHPQHLAAQERGRHELYMEYQIYSAEIDYSRTMRRQ
jgi:heme-degrading monooxygenase HmoA